MSLAVAGPLPTVISSQKMGLESLGSIQAAGQRSEGQSLSSTGLSLSVFN